MSRSGKWDGEGGTKICCESAVQAGYEYDVTGGRVLFLCE